MASSRPAWCWSLVLAAAGCGQEYDVLAEPVDVDPEAVMDCGFSPVSGTHMAAYDCNPVFTGTEEEWGEDFISVGFTQEVLGHPFYQIWYTAQTDNNPYGLGYAASSNGTDWETHPDNPLIEADGGWDATQMDQVQVVWDDTLQEYTLWYQGFNLATNEWGLGIFTSLDGVQWEAFQDGAPVLDFTRAFGGVTYCWPLGVTHSREIGYFGYIAGQPSDKNVCQMYRFSGENLDESTGFDLGNSAVLQAGPDDYDLSGMASSAIVQYADTWYMFYVGFQGWEQHDGYQSTRNHSLAMATSTDGTTWVKHPDNPLPVSLQPEGLISSVAAQVTGSRIHLWITDYYSELGQQAVGYYLYEPDIEPYP